MPWMLEPADAARRIADGLARGKAEIVFPLADDAGHEGGAAGAGAAVERGHVPAGATRRLS